MILYHRSKSGHRPYGFEALKAGQQNSTIFYVEGKQPCVEQVGTRKIFAPRDFPAALLDSRQLRDTMPSVSHNIPQFWQVGGRAGERARGISGCRGSPRLQCLEDWFFRK